MAPSSTRQALASGWDIFQPSRLLPSKIFTKPSSESAALKVAAVAKPIMEANKSDFIRGVDAIRGCAFKREKSLAKDAKATKGAVDGRQGSGGWKFLPRAFSNPFSPSCPSRDNFF